MDYELFRDNCLIKRLKILKNVHLMVLNIPFLVQNC